MKQCHPKSVRGYHHAKGIISCFGDLLEIKHKEFSFSCILFAIHHPFCLFCLPQTNAIVYDFNAKLHSKLKQVRFTFTSDHQYFILVIWKQAQSHKRCLTLEKAFNHLWTICFVENVFLCRFSMFLLIVAMGISMTLRNIYIIRNFNPFSMTGLISTSIR